ncbi:hypothetical protein A2U01_0081040 [Trifolium medium]|uniref:Uncharacterized protein n=1 Tax=Trifolium medium TaxID=97028 RepID=A0A392TIN7_9FABA|nr:hypothetical protein [Trifolium medium]
MNSRGLNDGSQREGAVVEVPVVEELGRGGGTSPACTPIRRAPLSTPSVPVSRGISRPF